MFWDNVAWAYDIFADGINRKANRALRAVVAEAIRPGETVLECACGTGLLSGAIAERCGSLVATDLSEKMLRRAERKCARYGNVRFERGDILRIAFPDESFDAVVAGNVIHLLDEPRIEVSLKETDMSSVIEEVAGQQSDLGVLFVTDMTESFIRRILDGRNLEFFGLVRIRPHVFLRRGHPLAQCAAVTPEQLRAYPSVVFTQRESNLNYAEEAVVGSGADFDRVVYINDRATAYNVIAHTDCVSTGSGVLPEGYGDERLVSIPLCEQVGDMRLGYVKLRGIPLTEQGAQFVDILKKITAEIGESL